MKKLMLGLMMAFAVAAEAEVTIDGFEYELDTQSKTATLTGYTGSPTNVDVSEVEDEDGQKYTVTSIGMSVFQGCSSLTLLSLPNARTIGVSAFDCCQNLKKVYLPNATMIGESAFWDCEKLTSVSLPNATTIGGSAFSACGSLTSVSLPNATTIGNGAFYQCGLTSVSFQYATTIGGDAFSNCKNLKEVSLPNATTIAAIAFQDCTSLTSVSLPSATTIGEGAFWGCGVLSSLVVNADMAAKIKENWTYYGFDPTQPPTITVFQPLSEDVVKAAGYEYETQVSVSSVVKSGGTVIDENDYLVSCAIRGVTPQKKLAEADFKVVSKDAQVIGSDEIAVTKESIAAAKAMTVQVVNGQIELSVSVCSNADITASSANWAPVKFTKDTQIGLSADGTKLVLPIPVAAQQGFMILQSGDAKVSEGEVRGLVIGEPWYKPTVED